MSNPDEGTSEFKVASLRDLLEGDESGPPAKGKGKGKGPGGRGGGDRNRRLAVIGGAAAGVLVLIVVVMLMAGGDGDGGGTPTDDDLFSTGFEIRSAIVSQVAKGDRISVCSPSEGPLAENIAVTGKTVDDTAIGGFATVLVDVTEEQAVKLSSIPDDTEVYEKNRCVRFGTTAPSTAPPAEPTPATGPPDTTPATTPPG